MGRRTIRELREARGWSQAELAHRLGVAPGAIFSWETNRHDITARRLKRLAALFGVSMDDVILPGEEDGERTPT